MITYCAHEKLTCVYCACRFPFVSSSTCFKFQFLYCFHWAFHAHCKGVILVWFPTIDRIRDNSNSRKFKELTPWRLFPYGCGGLLCSIKDWQGRLFLQTCYPSCGAFGLRSLYLHCNLCGVCFRFRFCVCFRLCFLFCFCFRFCLRFCLCFDHVSESVYVYMLFLILLVYASISISASGKSSQLSVFLFWVGWLLVLLRVWDMLAPSLGLLTLSALSPPLICPPPPPVPSPISFFLRRRRW